jgi:hypothetical protein
MPGQLSKAGSRPINLRIIIISQVWFKNRRAKCRQQQKAAEQINKTSLIKAVTPTTSSTAGCCKTPPSGADSTASDDETAAVPYVPTLGGTTAIHWTRDCWSLTESSAPNYYLPHCAVNGAGYTSYAHSYNGYYGNGGSRSYDNDVIEYDSTAAHHCNDNSWTDTGICYTNEHKFHAL